MMFFLYLAIFYYAMFVFYFLEACSYLKRERNGVDVDGHGVEEELVALEGVESIIRL